VRLRQPGADRVDPVANDSLADLALQVAFVEEAAMEKSVVTCTANFIHPAFRLISETVESVSPTSSG
jgi:hypothetical protein